MKKYLRYLGPVLITALFVLAIYLLYHKLKAYSIAQIRESIQQVSTGSICFSIGLMVVNYIILVGYDWLALKAIHKSLPLPRVGLVSLVGQAVSYNFGALLGGTSVRYRFYSAWGFSLVEIVRLVLMLAVTFWVGALGLCGVVFLWFLVSARGMLSSRGFLFDRGGFYARTRGEVFGVPWSEISAVGVGTLPPVQHRRPIVPDQRHALEISPSDPGFAARHPQLERWRVEEQPSMPGLPGERYRFHLPPVGRLPKTLESAVQSVAPSKWVGHYRRQLPPPQQ